MMTNDQIDDPTTTTIDLTTLSPRAMRGLEWYAQDQGLSLARAALVTMNELEHPEEPPDTWEGEDHQLRVAS